jgi:hypothetical protein
LEVLNAGGTPNVAGFRAAGSGLAAIAGGSQPLSATASGPEDVAISPDGRQVVVTEKLSDTIDTFAVGQGGALAAAVTSPSDSPLSFAELFTPSGQPLVADDGSAGTSAVSPLPDRARRHRARHPGRRAGRPDRGVLDFAGLERRCVRRQRGQRHDRFLPAFPPTVARCTS